MLPLLWFGLLLAACVSLCAWELVLLPGATPCWAAAWLCFPWCLRHVVVCIHRSLTYVTLPAFPCSNSEGGAFFSPLADWRCAEAWVRWMR